MVYTSCELEIVLPVMQVKTKTVSRSQLVKINKELIVKFYILFVELSDSNLICNFGETLIHRVKISCKC